MGVTLVICLYLLHILTLTGAFAPNHMSELNLVSLRNRVESNSTTRVFALNFLDKFFGGDTNNNNNRNNKIFTLEEEYDLCIIGGGVSGMTSALTFTQEEGKIDKKVIMLEASSSLGGRVQSDVTEDGYILDRGFAVFIEAYPFARRMLDYENLELCRFEPGALVYTGEEEGTLFKVADPIRRPADTFVALTAPIGEFSDKLKVIPLLVHVFTQSIDDLFTELETDTLSCLKDRWGFSDKFISQFMRPFLEGIYLAPLEQQSSCMFHFVFKMFSEGYACLPKDGMKGVAVQMSSNCENNGIEIKTDCTVTSLDGDGENGFIVKTNRGKVHTKSIVLATEGNVAEKILSKFSGVDESEAQIQRSVGCLYYTFNSKVPVIEPILILNGSSRDPKECPVNNVCFPSMVASRYSPGGDANICSVTILKPAMDLYAGKMDELDTTVRKQLSTWFPPEFSDDILNKWELKGMYNIQSAQPAQFGGVSPANANGGKDCSVFRKAELPSGLFVCGDHMATATLNGAFESGINAGKAAASFYERQT
mmetsp:Transcript_2492/g.3511  ORF Transcript_2492/g.3511 Transcript_2492/m.3511 type:complete len:537 (-) Transcript_2492:122-1732(-)|eukprot:CAMPEP_0184860114 /NCGR_PEP_ID=MMETSP0580-20130426/5058_1 /TAXON_ID=1118495 /ORGANISM="Dactyliosolen fragilissimus" /LENGTH=536 /DNA_ID=CAMNT_0027357093 /DNA_START=136 /DNA_END=1746 /DNA_ORIENTATION=+